MTASIVAFLLFAIFTGGGGANLHVQPVQTALAHFAGISEAQKATTDIVTEVVQVGMHWICTPPEVHGVREVEDRLVPELVSNLYKGGHN